MIERQIGGRESDGAGKKSCQATAGDKAMAFHRRSRERSRAPVMRPSDAEEYLIAAVVRTAGIEPLPPSISGAAFLDLTRCTLAATAVC
jgi:hypothetical protein